MPSDSRTLADERCPRCGVFLEGDQTLHQLGEGDGQGVCPYCWLHEVRDTNPDYLFFMNCVGGQQGLGLMGGVAFTLSRFIEAVESLRTGDKMRRFLRGYAAFQRAPGVSVKDAEEVARRNTGCVVAGLSLWRRLMWRWSAGVTPQELFYG